MTKTKMTPSRERRVLIVEDEPDALELIHWWTEAQGWDARTARTGSEALQISSFFKPEVLITDYYLDGEINGLDVIEKVRSASTTGVRCVLVTGVLGRALAEDVRRLHGVPILTKPFDFERLGELLTDKGRPPRLKAPT